MKVDMHVRLGQCVAHCDVPRDAFSWFPWQQCDTVRSLPISSKQTWQLLWRQDVCLSSPHQFIQAVMLLLLLLLSVLLL